MCILGPTLPMPIKGQALVTYKDTFLAVGGVDDEGLDGTQIYQLKCSSTNCKSSYWHKMEQSLMFGRKFATAMMIPDILTNCMSLQSYREVSKFLNTPCSTIRIEFILILRLF